MSENVIYKRIALINTLSYTLSYTIEQHSIEWLQTEDSVEALRIYRNVANVPKQPSRFHVFV